MIGLCIHTKIKIKIKYETKKYGLQKESCCQADYCSLDDSLACPPGRDPNSKLCSECLEGYSALAGFVI